jgi:FeS assembly protein IscX
MPKLTWNDTDELGYMLSRKYPDINPLSARFTDLRRYVMELADFEAPPEGCNERVLEAIQMAWLGYYTESQ